MERCWRLCGRQRPEERVRLRLVNRAFERYVRYRRGRNEKNESRTVFENLKATFLEHLTHTRFISRKVGFSRRCTSKNRRVAGRLALPEGYSDALVDLQKASKLESFQNANTGCCYQSAENA